MDMRFGIQNNIETIRKEHRRIDEKWLHRHYQLILWSALFVTIGELVMFFVLREIEQIKATRTLYLIKYLAVPAVGNFLLALAATLIIRSHAGDRKKVYMVSLLMAGMAFLVYTIHAVFPAMFLVFTIPMILTVIYGIQRLTGITALFCIGGKALSDLLVYWDPMRPHILSTPNTAINFLLSLVLLTTVYGICAFMILAEQEKLNVVIQMELERQRYQEAAVTDQLTQVWNRQALRQMFQIMEAERTTQRFFLAMLDMDDFKSLNDTYGHRQGDQYLKSLGEALLALGGEQMVSFRFGGDEFCVVFCGCEPEQVQRLCESIQRRFAEAEINRRCRPVSISIGVAEFRLEERPAQLLDRADQALYRAKQNKDSICFEK